MRRIVLDSNIYLSALVFRGLPARLLGMTVDKSLDLLYSTAILSEVERKLLAKFNYSYADTEQLLDFIQTIGEEVHPSIKLQVCRDPNDNHILECAVEGGADAIVTGDRDLLVLNPFQRIPVLTVRQFLDTLQTNPTLPLE